MSSRPNTCSFKTCHNIPEPGKRLCRRCLDRANKTRQDRIASGLCNNCNRPAVSGKKRCESCGEWARKYARAHKLSLTAYYRYRDLVFAYYGGKCVCCSETEPVFLTIDHINGRELVPEKHQTGQVLYARLARAINHGEPRTDVRVLCYNCNSGRYRNGGVCPHEANRGR